MNLRKYENLLSLLIGLVAALFFLPFLGNVHLFDWDEINFAEAAREMIVLKDYLRVHIDFLPFWEKPPLFIWLQVIAMKIFGINEYAARFPNALCGIFTLVVIFRIGKFIQDVKFGLLWALAYFGSILPHLYFKSGIIDPWFNLFIFSGLYFFILAYWKRAGLLNTLKKSKGVYFIISGFFIGLALLTKGPVAYLIPALCFFVYWFYKRLRLYVSIPDFFLYTFVVLSVAGLWFGVEAWANGPWFFETFITYQIRLLSTEDAGHGGFLGYHFVVLLLGCFPASIFAIRSLARRNKGMSLAQKDFKLWMSILFWVVIILFSLVKSKIVHYSSLAYFPLTYLAALSLWEMVNGKDVLKKWMHLFLYTIGGLLAFLLIAVPFVGNNLEKLKPLIKDQFTKANLDAINDWTYFESIAGLVLLSSLVLAIYKMRKSKQKLSAVFILFGGTALSVQLILFFIIGKVENISQRAAIEFIKSVKGKGAYVVTKKYKSYATYFYSESTPEDRHTDYSRDWLHYGKNIDKDVYIITKVHKKKAFEAEVPDAVKVEERNGYVLYVRKAKD